MTMVDLSIIIVNFNTKSLLVECLKSLVEATRSINSEIIVVDNGSTDNSINEIRNSRLTLNNLKIIENNANLGYAKANNLGIKASSGRYILLLNSDTIVYPKTLTAMIQFLNMNPQVGVATCRVELSNGELDPACHRGFPTPWASLSYFLGLEKLFPKSELFSQYHLGFLSIDKFHEIDSPTGAFYLIKKEVIDKVGLLDEDYFMYGEDLDWSYRIKAAGWKIMFNPEVKIIHFKKRSGRNQEDKNIRKMAKIQFFETMKIFYNKHYRHRYPTIITRIILSTINVKKSLIID
ncbi:MAG: glycosyltransferase family 2 protein [Candidatus Gottesmanbacteria bacterium]